MVSKKTKTDKSVKKIAAIYCRVSVINYAVEESSVETQEKILKEYCDRKGWAIYNVFVDEGESGGKWNRPNFKKLLEHAKQKDFDILLAHKIDRISRSTKDWYKLIEKLEEYDIDIVTISPEIDTTGPFGALQRNILISFAEFERSMARERTLERMHTKAQKGEWIGGRPPIGYKLENKKLILVDDHAQIIKKIYQLYSLGIGPSEIAQKLNDKGIRKPIRTTKNGKKSGGGKFTRNFIYKSLRNSVYAGYLNFQGRRFQGNHTPIIAPKEWEKIQNKFNRNNNKPSPRLGTGQTLLLTGILKCGFCNSHMTTSGGTKKKMKDGSIKQYYYYKCTNQIHKNVGVCKNRQVTADALDNTIIEFCTKLVNDPEFIKRTEQRMKLHNDDRIEDTEQEIKKLSGEISDLSKKIDNLTNVIADNPDQNIKSLVKKIDDFENSRDQLHKRKQKLTHYLDTISEDKIELPDIFQRFAKFGEIFDSLSRDQQRRVINTIVKEISIKIPKNSKNGTIKIKPWNHPSQGFEYDVNKGLNFVTNRSGGGTRTPNLVVNSHPLCH